MCGLPALDMIPVQVKEQQDSSLDARATPVGTGSDDFALMEGIAARDASALQRMYDKHSPLVLALCIRVLHDRAEAEDVLVDVFWELWDRANRYDPRRGNPLTYLTTLARSRAIDRRRSKGRVHPVDLDATSPATAPASDSPESGIVAGENAVLVKKALLGLDPAQRQAIECAFYDGLSHTEIAEKLGKPLGTVKTYIRQGLIRLRQSLRISNGGDA
jgi:RNA polymerase sigma-70 factor, ECF subfamily